MDLSIVMKMAHSPVKNYAIPGLTSWLISETDSGTIRMFHMERDHIECIVPHSHRFDFHCIVLEGEVENILYIPCPDYEPGDRYSRLVSTYCGEIGSYENSRKDIRSYNLSRTVYNVGDQYSMSYDEIHSIRFKKETKVLFFEGPMKAKSSVVLEPVVDGEIIHNFKVEPWMFKKQS